MLRPISSTSWELKYLGGKDLVDGKPVLTDSKNGAFAFADVEDANGWIERNVDGLSGYTRNNFNVVPYSPLASEYETKNVATSDSVVVSKDFVNGLFDVNSIGEGEERLVFLTRKMQPNLPSRFAVKEQPVAFNLDTSQLINLKAYERSIRRRDSEGADVANHVYLNTSPGFYEISPWLTDGRLKGYLIGLYNGSEERRIGPWLEDGATFTCEVSWDDDDVPSEAEFTFPFGVKRAEWVSELPVDGEGNPTGEFGVLYMMEEDEGRSTVEKHYYVEIDDEAETPDKKKYVETTDSWNGLVGKSTDI